MTDFRRKLETVKQRMPIQIRRVNDVGVVIALLLLCVVMSILSPNFLTFSNFMNILVQISIISIIAVGMTFVILTGGIDLSVGSTVAFCGLLLGTFIVTLKLPIWSGIMIAIVTGTLIGC